MKDLHRTGQDATAFNNNNEGQNYQKLDDSLDNGTGGKRTDAKERSVREEDRCRTNIRRRNAHSYVISCEPSSSQHRTALTLSNVHTDLMRQRADLMENQGLLHMKEHALDGYECRCHERDILLNDEKSAFHYKIEF